MRDGLIAALILLPGVLLAARSRAGSHAGYFVGYGWLGLAVIGGVFGWRLLLCATAGLLIVGWIFREGLALTVWLAQGRRASRRLGVRSRRLLLRR